MKAHQKNEREKKPAVCSVASPQLQWLTESKIGMSKKWDNDYKCDRLKSNYNCLTVFSNNASNISIKLI